MSNTPTIGVVVVHYGADELTVRCLRALVADTVSPAFEVVLVDNGPGEAFADLVRSELPAVQVLLPGENLGFAAGCNRGVAALGPVDLVALVNSDMDVPPGWLVPLVETVQSDERLGAACPKIRFDGRFHTIAMHADATWRRGWGDTRELAWRLEGVRVGGIDVTGRCHLVEGFWEPEREGTWAGPRAVLRIPEVEGARQADVLMATPPGRAVGVRVDGGQMISLGGGRGTFPVALTTEPDQVLNNVGNRWRDDGYGIDVGFQEVDAGQHDLPGPVEAWCGGAVLLRRAYLDDTGGFDERLFLYYEDLELSLRGASKGWGYRYDPRAVVSHRHAASGALQPRRVARLKERNRLLLLARHGTSARLMRELLRFCGITLSYVRRDVVSAAVRGDPPWWGTVRTRAAALAAALPLLPGMILSRRRDGAARRGMGPLV